MQAAFDWSGFYIGGNGGYAWGHSKGIGAAASLAPNSGPPYDFSTDGGFGGGFAGAQKQWGQLVVGIEADWQGASLTGNGPPTLVGITSYTVSTKVKSYNSVRGRLGFATDKWLLFVTGGWASARWSTSYAFTGGGPFVTNNASKDGWTAGAGVNYALINNLFLTLEYRYTSLGASTFVDAGANAGEIGNKVNISDVRAGVGLKF